MSQTLRPRPAGRDLARVVVTSRRASRLAWAATAFLMVAAGSPAAQAESLRCNGVSAVEGESRLSLLYKCGQPVLADQYCAPVWHGPTRRWITPVGALGCQVVEEWLYDRGPGQLMATVRLRDGVVQTIVYGQQPR